MNETLFIPYYNNFIIKKKKIVFERYRTNIYVNILKNKIMWISILVNFLKQNNLIIFYNKIDHYELGYLF